MSLNANKIPHAGGAKIDPIDAGTYPARLVQVIGLGLQPQRPWQGEEKPPAHEIMFTYEMLDEFLLDEDGEERLDKPRWFSETMPIFSLQADKAKSTKRYYALDPEVVHEGDFAALVAAPCMVTMIQKEGVGNNAGKIYNNVFNVSAMRPKEAAKAAPLVNKPKVFDPENPDREVFDALPAWLQDKMKDALDYEGGALQAMLEAPAKKPKAAKKPKVEENAAAPARADMDTPGSVGNDDEEDW